MDKKNPAICAMAAILVALSAFSAYAQECTPGLTLDTDSVAYLQGDQVTVSGTRLELNCSPVGISTGIGATVLLPLGSPFYAQQLGTNDLGEFGFTFTLPSDAALGEWSIVAAYGSAFDDHAFTVSGGDCLEGDTQQCGQTSEGVCTFGIETCTAGEWAGCTAVFPVPEVCDDGLDNDCDGSVDEDCPSGGGGSSGSGGTCLPLWSCTEWEDCQSDGTQTRTCERVIPGCGTSTVPPEETQDCEYTEGSQTETCEEFWTCTDWSECVEGSQSRTCSDENSCGTEESRPSESQSCQLAEAGSEGGPPTGLVIGDIVGSYMWLLVVLILIGAGAFLKFRK